MSIPSRWSLFPAAILLVGLNLRPILAVVGPLLDTIQHATGLSDAGASLLTTLPVALMGACLFAAARLQVWLGERRGVAVGLVLIGSACLIRWWWPNAGTMIASAVLGGIGIAIVQALLPTAIRRRAGRRSARLMGIYSTAIMGGAVVASGLGPWIAQAGGWPFALGIWALLIVPALLFWAQVVAPMDAAPLVPKSNPLWRAPIAWLLLAFFGLGTGAYTLVLAWLPPFYTQLGWSARAAGALLSAVTLSEVIAGISVSLWVDRLPDRRPALFLAIASLLLGLLCLCLAPLALAWPAALLVGLGIGALFPLSLIVAMDQARNPGEAGAIAGFVQGGGYMLAALLPLAAGLLRQNLSDLTPAWWLMAALCFVLALIAVRLRPGATRISG